MKFRPVFRRNHITGDPELCGIQTTDGGRLRFLSIWMDEEGRAYWFPKLPGNAVLDVIWEDDEPR